MKVALAVLALLVAASSACRPRNEATSQVKADGQSSFVQTLQDIPCVKFASENVNSSLPGGGKPTGEYTVSVNDPAETVQCWEMIRELIPGVRHGALNEQLGTITGITPPGGAAAPAGTSFVATLEDVPCVRFASENKNSSLPGGGKATGEYTVAVKNAEDTVQCWEMIRELIPGVRGGTPNQQLGTIVGIRPPGSSETAAGPAPAGALSFTEALQSVACVKFASENKNSSAPGGGKGTGVYTVAVKDGIKAKQCATAIRTALPGITLGTANDQLGTIVGIKPPKGFTAGKSAAGDRFTQELQGVPCVRLASANVNSSLAGGGKPTGEYTVAVKNAEDTVQCWEMIRELIPGVLGGKPNAQLGTITGIRAP